MAKHYIALDGLRGVAAIIVMYYHRRFWSSFDLPLEHAGLAVDFFFMLSGFVVALAYERKISSGMRFTEFSAIRLARLGPLIVLGALIGIGYYLVLAIKHKYSFGFAEALAMMLSPFSLPTPLPANFFPQTPFPVNFPSWSLFFELFSNAVFALVALNLRGGVLITIIVAALLWLGGCLYYYGSIGNFGNAYGKFIPGFPRVLLPFFMGVLIWRCIDKIRLIVFPGGFWIAAFLLSASLVVNVPTAYAGVYELGFIIFLCPLIVVIGACSHLSGRGAKIAIVAGHDFVPDLRSAHSGFQLV